MSLARNSFFIVINNNSIKRYPKFNIEIVSLNYSKIFTRFLCWNKLLGITIHPWFIICPAMRRRCVTNIKYKNNHRLPLLFSRCMTRMRVPYVIYCARIIHAARRVSRTTTTNFTKCRTFRDRARSGSFLDGEEIEKRADRKFKWDLWWSLAHKSIVITGADRVARLISRTIYDDPAARDRSRRSPDELGIEDWSGAAKRSFQVCRWKWQTFRFVLQQKPCAGTTISRIPIYFTLFAKNSKRLSGTREWSATAWNFMHTINLWNEIKNNFPFLNIEREIKIHLCSRLTGCVLGFA